MVRLCVKTDENGWTFPETSQEDFRGVLLNQNRSTLRSERRLLQSLITWKLFTLNGATQKPDIGPKILTPQETWELIAAIVKASLTPPSELKDNGILKEHEAIPFRKSKALNRGCDGPSCHAEPKQRSQPKWTRSIWASACASNVSLFRWRPLL